MYQLHLTVREYVGCWGVQGVLSDTDEHGRVTTVATCDERLFQPPEGSQDALGDCYRVLVAWARLSD